jgi:enoyl-CoA hydratase
MPYPAIEICRQRLSPAHFSRATTIAEPFSPANAVEAGFLDRVVAANELDEVASTLAAQLATLDMACHARTKLRVRGQALQAIRAGIDIDYPERVPAGA